MRHTSFERMAQTWKGVSVPELKVNRALAFEVWTQADQGTPPKAMQISTEISPRTIARLCRAKRTFENGGALGTLTEGSRWSLRFLGELKQWFDDYQATKAQEKDRQETQESAGHADNQRASGRPEAVPFANSQPEVARLQDRKNGGPEQVDRSASSGSLDATSQTPPPDLTALHLSMHGSMHGPGWPSLSPDTRYWVLRVRLENLSEKPVSFGDICLHVTRDVPEDNEIHSWPHLGWDTYGSHGGVPLADQALPTLISLTPESPVLEGALRFQDDIPFESDSVRLTLRLKGTGQYYGTERSWELGAFPNVVGDRS